MTDPLPARALPPAGAIDLWRFRLDDPLRADALPGHDLSEDERLRAARFLFPADADRFRLCRAMLRSALAWYLRRPPQSLPLAAGPFGKPYLAGSPELFFNVSHTRGLALIAFTTVGEVGVDLEPLDQPVEAMDIAASHFTPNEAVMIASASPQHRAALFLRLWTRKEAVLKAAGRGILDGLNTLDVTPDVTQPAPAAACAGAAPPAPWRVRDLDPPIEGYAAAVAAPPGEWRLIHWPVRCADFIARLGSGE